MGRNLNTSYVSIQSNIDLLLSLCISFKYILCFYSISEINGRRREDCEFKYILCFYSIMAGVSVAGIKDHLNTSYVSIQSG